MRQASIDRKTAETQISVSLKLDGTGESSISTGIGFFDHMLTLFAKHSLSDVEINAQGDLEVDFHHTVEDVGIVLGQCFREALGDKKGVRRYGSMLLPMDETLARVAVDFSGRPFHHFEVPENAEAIGGNFPFSLVEEFFRAFSFNALMNLHQTILYGRDSHHLAEALFKGTARAIDEAKQIDDRIVGMIPSTKEKL